MLRPVARGVPTRSALRPAKRGASARPVLLRALPIVAALAVVAGACTERGDGPAVDGPAGVGSAREEREVVIYASVDQNYSEPVLDAFEAETGIRVKPVYDVEAAKTTGLVNRLLAEKPNPVADVWWSGEFAQTIELADKGVLAPYESPEAAAIPAGFVDADGLWTGFGGRARVLLVNTDRLEPDEYPDSLFDLAGAGADLAGAGRAGADQPGADLSGTVRAGAVAAGADLSGADVDPASIGMAHPVFGTTATHAAALYAVLGDERARAFFETLRDRGVKILDGNALVRDQVADGRLAFGVTDTDDACGALARGAPVEIVFPDQAEGAIGTLVVPNTVALVDGAPNEDAAKELIDYLLREETARDMLESGWIQLTLRPMEDAGGCVDASEVRSLYVSLTDVASRIEQVKLEMADVFVR